MTIKELIDEATGDSCAVVLDEAGQVVYYASWDFIKALQGHPILGKGKHND